MKGTHYQGPRYRRDGSGIIRVSVEDEPTNGRQAAAEDDRRWEAAGESDPPMFDEDEGSGGESEAERREADDYGPCRITR